MGSCVVSKEGEAPRIIANRGQAHPFPDVEVYDWGLSAVPRAEVNGVWVREGESYTVFRDGIECSIESFGDKEVYQVQAELDRRAATPPSSQTP